MSKSTGEISTLSFPNPMMDVNTGVFANPHIPFTQNATKVAKIHNHITYTL